MARGPAKWKIPEQYQDHIRALALEDDRNDIRMIHNKKQYDKHCEDGNVEAALRCLRVVEPDLKRKGRRAHKALWKAIHACLPELDQEYGYEFNQEKMEIRESQNNPLKMILGGPLGGMAQQQDNDDEEDLD